MKITGCEATLVRGSGVSIDDTKQLVRQWFQDGGRGYRHERNALEPEERASERLSVPTRYTERFATRRRNCFDEDLIEILLEKSASNSTDHRLFAGSF